MLGLQKESAKGKENIYSLFFYNSRFIQFVQTEDKRPLCKPCIMKRKLLKSVLCLLLLNLLEDCTSVDTITPTQPLKDGAVLISEGQVFALGFFSIGNSSNRYLGIWYNTVSEQTVVWVANRDNPITDNSGVLSIDETRNLVLHCCNRTMPLWSTNVSVDVAAAQKSSAQVLDVGNFVLYEGNSDSIIAWQSFDHPADTYLPYMKLGIDRRTGINWFLTSWKSQDNPGVGQYSLKIKLTGVPQFFLYQGSVPIWQTGPWKGIQWSGVPDMAPNVTMNHFTETNDEIYIMYGTSSTSILTRLVVTDSGIVDRLTWQEVDRRWVSFWSAPVDRCDTYSHCGVFGYCDPNKKAGEFDCSCFPGFQPRLAHDWSLRDGSKGCIRNPGVQVCQNGEGFVKLENAKVPDTSNALVDESLDIKACEKLCLSNCSCTAYANANISSQGSGCMTWYGDLIDTRLFSNWGQDLYIRVDAAELGFTSFQLGFNH